jgi:hypothetical protein
MSVSKKARYVSSITNRTTIFGIMGGLSNSVGVLAANQSAIRNKASNQQVIPLNPVAGLNYMKGNNPMGRIMLSRNPQCSGGVGRTSGGGFAGCSPATNVSNSLLLSGGGGCANAGPGTSVIVAADTPGYTGLYRGFTACDPPGLPNSGSVSPFRGITLLVANIGGGTDFAIFTTSTDISGNLTISGPGIVSTTYDLTIGATPTDVGDGTTQWSWSGPPGSPASPVLVVGNSYNLTTTF